MWTDQLFTSRGTTPRQQGETKKSILEWTSLADHGPRPKAFDRLCVSAQKRLASQLGVLLCDGLLLFYLVPIFSSLTIVPLFFLPLLDLLLHLRPRASLPSPPIPLAGYLQTMTHSYEWRTLGCVLCTLAVVYWVTSFAVLLLRVCVPAFAALTEYGGRQPEEQQHARASGRTNSTPLARLFQALQSSFLGSCRVDRQTAFALFYLSGVLSCVALGRLFCPLPTLSLCLFGLHCLVRLLECFLGRSARAAGEDEVTLFATVAGCSFYVFASISSCPFTSAVTDPRSNRITLTFGTIGLIAVYLALCAVQVWCHSVLRRMRARRDVRTPQPGQQPSTTAPRASGRDKAWVYRFPRSWPFTWVQEPHYLCEILLYVVQALLLLSTAPGSLGHAFCETCLVGVASWGVLLFTALNLGITGHQHRRFWRDLNRQRLALAEKQSACTCDARPVPKPESLPRWVVIPGVY